MTNGTIATVELGDGGPEVGAQGLGCMGMSFAYGPSDAGSRGQPWNGPSK